MAERMAVGRAELRGEIDVAAELEHPVVVAREDRLGLRRRQVELLEVLRLVRLEGLAVLVLHERHAEHVDAESLARTLRIEHEGAGDVVIVVLRACHRRLRFLQPFQSFEYSSLSASLRAKRSNPLRCTDAWRRLLRRAS